MRPSAQLWCAATRLGRTCRRRDWPSPEWPRVPAPSRRPRSRSSIRPMCARGSPRQRLLGDAERRLEQHAGDPGHGPVPLLARLAVVGRSRRIAGLVAPGKRPRLTPSPALALGPDGRAIPFGTPGGDVQAQAMLQTLLNRIVFGMDPQAAVEAPRFATYSFPDSFEPHSIQPGRLVLEARLPQSARRSARRASATTCSGGPTGPGRPAPSA